MEDFQTPTFEPYEDEDTKPTVIPDRDDFDTFDQYIGAEVLLPHRSDMLTGKVRERKRNNDGSLKGTPHETTMFDSRSYVVEFPNGTEAEYTANIIAENMYAQCTPDGQQFIVLQSLCDHKKDETAISKDDAYVTVNGRTSRRKTTKGWSLCVEWKDGTTSWEKLSPN